MTRHSPQIAVTAARIKLEVARDECPHWDYESDGEGYACCSAVAGALGEYRRARRAAKRGMDQRPVG